MAIVMTERIHPERYTCYDVVATGRYPYTGKMGMLQKEDEEKIEEAMRQVQVEALRDQDFERISDGQRQRVMPRLSASPARMLSMMPLRKGTTVELIFSSE